MRYLILIILAVTSGCGKATINIEDDLVAYYNSFIRDAKAEGFDFTSFPITIEFGDTSGTIAAVCSRSNSVPKITVRRTFWDNVNDSMKKELIFHELGHCILNRGHDSTFQQSGGPTSIMFPNVFEISDSDWPYYVHELLFPI